MGQITIRGISPEFERHVRETARKNGKSLSRTLADMLEESISKKKTRGRRPGESLLSLAGGWDEQDALEFQSATQICEQVDEELWR